MVCLGNICRSPLAEGILRAKLSANFFIDSAGTGGWHIGESPDNRSISTAKNRGIDITNQRARQFTRSDFEEFDVIYVMDNANYKDVMALAPDEKAKAKVKFILNEIHPQANQDVPDPYYGSQDGFETVFDLLDQACEKIAQRLMR